MKVAILLLVAIVLTTQHDSLDQASLSAEINSMKTTWTAGHNHRFDGMSMAEIKTLMGTILETPEEHILPLKDITPLDDIPESFDPIDKWPNCESLKEIRDQSTCGSCWAFGAVEAMSDRLCIASGQKDQTRISAEDLLTCCSSCGYGCDGGYPSASWNYFVRTGLVTGDLHGDTKYCRPYTFPPCDHHTNGTYGPCGASKPTPQCVKQCSSDSGRSYSTDAWIGTTAYSIPSAEAKIQTELMTNGPIEVSFTVYADFLTYKSGVYQHQTGGVLGGHAVKMVGWGVEGGVKYWKVANSWNEGWGDHGYFKIIRGNNQCGIESGGVAGMVHLKNKEMIEIE